MTPTSQDFAFIDLSSPAQIAGLGKKASNLAEVATIPGARTPKGFALHGAVVDAYLETFRPAILSAVRTLPAIEAHAAIEQRMLDEPLTFDGALVAHLQEAFDPGTLFAVRSSAHPIRKGQHIAEDSEENSLAGQYSSFLRVPFREVPGAVARCCASLFNPRSIDIFTPHIDTTYIGSTMTVLVQEMVEATACGVMMTMDPLAFADGEEVIGIESSYGACEALVSGKTQGDLFILDRSSLRIVESELGTKRWRAELPVYGTRTDDGFVQVPEAARSTFSLSEAEVRAVAVLGKQIELHFGLPQDVEFVLDANREVVITQARPITTLKEHKR